MLAAEHGMSVIPNEWKSKTALFQQVEQYSKVIIGSNPYINSMSEKHCKMPTLNLSPFQSFK